MLTSYDGAGLAISSMNELHSTLYKNTTSMNSMMSNGVVWNVEKWLDFLMFEQLFVVYKYFGKLIL